MSHYGMHFTDAESDLLLEALHAFVVTKQHALAILNADLDQRSGGRKVTFFQPWDFAIPQLEELIERFNAYQEETA